MSETSEPGAAEAEAAPPASATRAADDLPPLERPDDHQRMNARLVVTATACPATHGDALRGGA